MSDDVGAAGRTCRRCAAELGADARFCTECGTAAPGSPAAGEVADAPRRRRSVASGLVRCDECRASNAPSRAVCARCGAPLHDEVPGGDALPEHLAEPPDEGDRVWDDAGRPRDSSPVLLALVVLAGLVTAGALLALVTSRASGPLATVVTEGVPLVAISASSELDEHPAALAADGDPATSWHEGSPGDGAGEFLVLQLEEPVAVRRVLVWNGDQEGDVEFAENGRASRLRVEINRRQFRADLLDVDGPQAIDLPEPVTAGTVRIVVERAIDGDRYPDLAISEVLVEAAAVE